MRRLVSALFTIAALAAPVSAQAHPDFTGKWVLDPKSIDASMGPVSVTMTVKQDAKAITVETDANSPMGEQKSSAVYNLDGSPSKNSANTPGGALELNSAGSWDGSVFVVTTKGEIQGQSLTQNDRWSLDADGKTLRLQRDVAAMGQSMSMKMVFNKQ